MSSAIWAESSSISESTSSSVARSTALRISATDCTPPTFLPSLPPMAISWLVSTLSTSMSMSSGTDSSLAKRVSTSARTPAGRLVNKLAA